MSLKYKSVEGRILPQVWGEAKSTEKVEVKKPNDVKLMEGARMPSGLMNKVYGVETGGLRGNVKPVMGQTDIEFPPTYITATPGNEVIRNRVRVNQHTTQWVA